MSEPKVAREVAEQEFDRWIEKMALTDKVDPSTLDNEDKKELAAHKATVLSAIMSGSLALDGDSQFVFTPTLGGEALTFFEPDGAAYMAIDQAKAGANVQKQFKFLAAIARCPVARFSSMKQRDLKVCLAIGSLF